MKLEPMPQGKRLQTLADYRAGWDAKMDNARRQARERIAAGMPLRGKSAIGGKSIRRL